MTGGAKVARSALSLYLATWLALFPVLQALHLATANHDHAYSSSHLQIEDIPRRARPASPACAAAFELSPTAAAASVDLLLSFNLQDSAPRRIASDGFAPDAICGQLLASPRDAHPGRAPIAVAPKTSPPDLAR